MNVALTFKNVVSESVEIGSKPDLLLGITAHFEIIADEKLLYHEESFPIVELRIQLDEWINCGFKRGDDFEFQSMETDEDGFVWFRHQDSNAWRVGSLYQEYVEANNLSDLEVCQCVDKYSAQVDSWVMENLDIEVLTFLQPRN